MVALISDKNHSVIDNNKSADANKETPQHERNSAADGEEFAAKRQNNAVSVSHAAQVLSQSATQNGVGNISSSERAAKLTQQVVAFFAENGAAALNTHKADPSVTNLLSKS